jgi:branched-chain amino acid transport system substrate-binding protein
MTALSGTFAFQGEEQLKVFNAAADAINAQGGVLGGRKLEIVPFDNKANPQESLVILKQVTDQDIRYVASTVSSVAHALSDAVAKYNARNPDRPILFLDFNALDPAAESSALRFPLQSPHRCADERAPTDSMAKDRTISKRSFDQPRLRLRPSRLPRHRRICWRRNALDIQICGRRSSPAGQSRDPPGWPEIRAGADSVLTGNWGLTDLSLLIKASNEAGLKSDVLHPLAAFRHACCDIRWGGPGQSIYSWHINAADEMWRRSWCNTRPATNQCPDMAYLPPFRVLGMLTEAMNGAGTTDPLKVAYALEGQYMGPSGESLDARGGSSRSGVRHELAKAGQPGVTHDAEGTALLVAQDDSAHQTTCRP